MRQSLTIIALIYILLRTTNADDNDDVNLVSITTSPNDFSVPTEQVEKRESQTETGFYNSQIYQESSNDEPFRPIYGPNISELYNAENTADQYELAQESQAEVYYDKPQLMTGIRYVAAEHNDVDLKATQKASSATPPPHSGVPLLGSYLSSSGGMRYSPSAYQGPFSPRVYEAKQQQQPPPQQQQTKSVLHTEKKLSTASSNDAETKISPSPQSDVKISHNNLFFTEPVANFFRNAKPYQQKQEQQHQLKQPIHQQHQQQQQQEQSHIYLPPFNLQQQAHHSIYNPHQHQSLSLHHNHHHHHKPSQPQLQPQSQLQQLQQLQHASPQHHIQYIIAIPLSHVRQLQQQLAFHQHSNAHTSLATPANTVIGPLARDHYGAYRPVHYSTSNHHGEHVSPAVHHYHHQEPQHATTQYIQLPNTVLHAAVQAAHLYHHRQQQNQQHQQQQHQNPQLHGLSSYQQSPPQYVYYPHQQQQQQQQLSRQQEPSQRATHQQAPIYANGAVEKPQLHNFQQETIIHIGGSKPSAKSTPTKTSNDNASLLPTPASTVALKAQHVLAGATSPAGPVPLVHYNPIYVQAPPAEQQPLFGPLNYHRFTSGGFEATTPVPLIRLSATPTHTHYYNALSQLPQHPAIHQLHAHVHANSHPHGQPHLPHHHHSPQPFHKTIFNAYAAEQIPNSIPAGLPFHYPPHRQHYQHYDGGQFYHQQPTPAYIAAPAIPAKAAEIVNAAPVGNQHRQQQEPQQSLHRQYPAPVDSVNANTNSGDRAAVSSGSATNSLVKYP